MILGAFIKTLPEIYSKKKFNGFGKSFKSVERSNSILVRIFGDKLKGKLLDIGAWNGSLGKILPDGVEYYPLDISSIDHKNAKKWDLNRGSLPYKGKYFDYVIASMILEHTFCPTKICSEIRRILKDDGFAIVGLPNESSIWSKINFILKSHYETIDEQEFQHHWMFDVNNTKDFLGRCGFRVVDIYPRFGITSKWVMPLAPIVWYKVVKKK
jgi:SAM-dependent methyltransferase